MGSLVNGMAFVLEYAKDPSFSVIEEKDKEKDGESLIPHK